MIRPDPAGVIERHAERLMGFPGVIGVAEGTRGGRPCVLVLVGRVHAELVAAIPETLEGVPTHIVETGAPEAFRRR